MGFPYKGAALKGGLCATREAGNHPPHSFMREGFLLSACPVLGEAKCEGRADVHSQKGWA